MAARVDRRRWGDEDPEDEDFLPPTEETEIDENGIKLRIEYFRNEKGQPVKKTTKIRVASVQQKVYKISQIRREWERFGQAAGSVESMTAVSNEEIPFENIRVKSKTRQQNKIEDIQKDLQSADKKTIVTGMDNMLQQRKEERQMLRAKGIMPPEPEPPVEDASKAVNPKKYVPPNLRGDAPPEDKYRRPGNENSVRVTNLSEEVMEDDLRDLFSPFGRISRIYLAIDKETNRSRGFAFINFVAREDAERAISKLNGSEDENLSCNICFSLNESPERDFHEPRHAQQYHSPHRRDSL